MWSIKNVQEELKYLRIFSSVSFCPKKKKKLAFQQKLAHSVLKNIKYLTGMMFGMQAQAKFFTISKCCQSCSIYSFGCSRSI